MKRIFRLKTRDWFWVHSFSGAVFGLLLFVVCWSGSFAVIADELDRWVTPEARTQLRGDWASWGDWLASVEAAYPGAAVSRLEAPPAPGSTALAVIDTPEQPLVRVYIEPHTAEVLGHSSYFTIQRFFRNFHSYLFIPEVGSYLVSFLSLSLLVSMLSGLFFYKRWWSRFFSFRGGSFRTLCSEWHKLTGLWSLWFLAVIGLTGCWYLAEMIRYDWFDRKYSYLGVGPASVQQVPEPSSAPGAPEWPLDQLVERVKKLRPELQLQMLHFTNSHPGVLYADGQAGHWLVRDRANQIYLDRQSGELLVDQNASNYPLYWRWSDMADPLHFGNFGGLWSKALWFVFGLLLCGLILSGTYLYLKKMSLKAERDVRAVSAQAGLVLAILVLAASVPFGFAEAKYFGPTIDSVAHYPELPSGVFAVLAAWICLTIAIVGVWVFFCIKARGPVSGQGRSVCN